jgi:hypothetical protein
MSGVRVEGGVRAAVRALGSGLIVFAASLSSGRVLALEPSDTRCKEVTAAATKFVEGAGAKEEQQIADARAPKPKLADWASLASRIPQPVIFNAPARA